MLEQLLHAYISSLFKSGTDESEEFSPIMNAIRFSTLGHMLEDTLSSTSTTPCIQQLYKTF